MALVITLKVVPNAKKTKVQLESSGEFKLYLKAPPIDGKANQELICYFSDVLKIPKKEVEILSGLTTRIKRIALHIELTKEELLQKLGIEEQLRLI